MGQPIKTITIEGFKSIRRLDAFPLGPLNVLIGANGAGKSNFVEFFRLMRALGDRSWEAFVERRGGGDGFFYLGPKVTPGITARVRTAVGFGDVQFAPTADNALTYLIHGTEPAGRVGPDGHMPDVFALFAGWTVYHFHDTSELSPTRREGSVYDDGRLRPDASNLAAYLMRLRTADPAAYGLIRDTVRLVAPFFDDFALRVHARGPAENVRLEWRQRGTDFPFQPYQLSDGTLRFICLATALLQPDLPGTIVIDEPELGLHPHALGVLAGLLRKASHRTQVIVATQSSVLVSEFEPEEIVVVSREGEASTFRRLGSDELAAFLEDYSLGDLWEKNYIDGASNG